MAIFNINTDAAVKFTNKLEKLHRSALPVAIRGTLNSAAFDVKKNTMPTEAKLAFEERNKAFFRATSRVQMAKGFSLRSMKSIVGFIGADKNQAVDDLNKQERGGTIGGRSFIAKKEARIGRNAKKGIKKANRIGNIRNIERVKSKKLFHQTVRKAGVGGHILYKNTLWNVKAISRGNIKLIPLYSYKKGRTVKVGATNFMRKATIRSSKKLETFYKIEAKKQINRLLK